MKTKLEKKKGCVNLCSRTCMCVYTYAYVQCVCKESLLFHAMMHGWNEENKVQEVKTKRRSHGGQLGGCKSEPASLQRWAIELNAIPESLLVDWMWRRVPAGHPVRGNWFVDPGPIRHALICTTSPYNQFG